MRATEERRPLVFLAHPISGNVQANLEGAARWLRWAIVEQGADAVAPYIGLCLALNDSEVAERARGIAIGNRILRRCEQVWLCGPRISRGMQMEARLALEHGIPVRDCTGSVPHLGPVFTGTAEELLARLEGRTA